MTTRRTPTPPTSKDKEKAIHALQGLLPAVEDKRQFRSNLLAVKKVVDMFREKITKRHTVLLDKSPFKAIFRAFYDNNIPDCWVRKSDADLMAITKIYNKDKNAFDLGYTTAMITPQDIGSIFGLPTSGNNIPEQLGRNEPPDQKWRKKHFKNIKRLDQKRIERALLKAASSKTDDDIKDSVRLFALYLCASLLFSNTSHTLPWHYVIVCYDLEKMPAYNWASAVHRKLMGALKSKEGNQAISGCVVALLYWFCKTTEVIPHIEEREEKPQFMWWNLYDLRLKLIGKEKAKEKTNRPAKTKASSKDVREPVGAVMPEKSVSQTHEDVLVDLPEINSKRATKVNEKEGTTNSQLYKQIEELQMKIKINEEVIGLKETEMQSIKSELEEVQKKLTEKEKLIEMKEAELKKQRKKIVDLNHEIEGLNTCKNLMDDQIIEMQKEMKMTSEEEVTKVREKDLEIQSLQNEVDGLFVRLRNCAPAPASASASASFIKHLKNSDDRNPNLNDDFTHPMHKKLKLDPTPSFSEQQSSWREELNMNEDVNADGGLRRSNDLSQTKISAGNFSKKLLVLDVNGVLAAIVPKGDVFYGRTPNHVIFGKAVFLRPFCKEFLQFCFDRFHVGIWSSKQQKNLEPLVRILMKDIKGKLCFCLDQSYCTSTVWKTQGDKPIFFKELKKLWEKMGDYNESNTLLVDDTPYKALHNPPNTAIFPPTYLYHLIDNSLGLGGDLREYLEKLASAENVQEYIGRNPYGQEAISNIHFY